jgi:hypothetical protein
VEQFRRYSDPPIACLTGDKAPDLVLIDGRFRIACALKALSILQDTTGWTLAIDDYTGRHAYRAITEFAHIDEIVAGRIAVIHSVKHHDPEELDESIRHYETLLHQ